MRICSTLAAVSIILGGCVNTILTATEPSAELKRLLAVNSKPIGFSIVAPPEATIGHQYLFVVLPFGRISADGYGLIRQTALLELGQRGYRPHHSTDSANHSRDSTPKRHLTLKLEVLRAAAFDLLVTRRLSCKVTIEADISSDMGLMRRGRARGSWSGFRRYGFKPQLTECLEGAIEQAVTTALNEMSL